MTAPIDWSRPIELDTVPPRPALVKTIYDDCHGASVYADWTGSGNVDWWGVNADGDTEMPDLPRVRNVATPTDDLSVAPDGAKRVQPVAIDDVTAELLAAGDNLAKAADSKLCTVRELTEAVSQWRAAAAKATGQ